MHRILQMEMQVAPLMDIAPTAAAVVVRHAGDEHIARTSQQDQVSTPDAKSASEHSTTNEVGTRDLAIVCSLCNQGLAYALVGLCTTQLLLLSPVETGETPPRPLHFSA